MSTVDLVVFVEEEVVVAEVRVRYKFPMDSVVAQWVGKCSQYLVSHYIPPSFFISRLCNFALLTNAIL